MKDPSDNEQHARLISAGLRARALRKQLAVTWLASQEIIDAMRALRKGIHIPGKEPDAVLEDTKRLPKPSDD